MAENTLVAKIQTDAHQQVAEIKADGEKTVAAITAETDSKLQALREAHASALQKQHEQLELVAVSKAKQEGKISLQQAKRDQIDAIFAEVESELIQQPADTYVAYFARVVGEQVPETANIFGVRAPANRLTETEQILKQAGLSGDVTADKTVKAGLLIETESGVYDVTLRRLLSEARPKLEMDIMSKVTE